MKGEVEKRMLSEPLATRYSRTKMEEHIDAVLREMEFNTKFFESHCVPTLLILQLFMMPMEGTLNIELVSIDPQ